MIYTSNSNYKTVSTQDTLTVYNPLNYTEYISFPTSYLSYQKILSNSFNVDNIKDDRTINFLINDNYYLIPEITDNEMHKYLFQSIKSNIIEYNKYENELSLYINNNKQLIYNINNNSNLINQATQDLKDSIKTLFSLKSFLGSYDLTYYCTIINNQMIIDNSTGSLDLYRGNKYLLNQSDNSNINYMNVDNTILNHNIILKKNTVNKVVNISINDILQANFNMVQGCEYKFDLTNDSIINSSLILLPSDSKSTIKRLNSNNVFTDSKIDNITQEYRSNFIFPLQFYINSKNENNGMKNFDYDEFLYDEIFLFKTVQ